ASFREVLAATVECAAIAVDMPIGLPDATPRAADVAARRLLGPRRSSVFPAPVRATLGSPDYRTARDRSLAACGRMLRIEAFNRLPKVREIDEALSSADQARIVESHPELCFATLNHGVPMAHNKKRAEGRSERAGLLSNAYGADVEALPTPRG